MRVACEDVAQQLRVQARRVDTDPVKILRGDLGNRAYGFLVVARGSPAACDDRKGGATLYLLKNESAESLKEIDINIVRDNQ